MTTTSPPSRKVLNWARIKLGVVGVLCAGDESAFSPFHTVIVRALGGGDVALGVIGAIMQSVAQLFSWIGAIFLRLARFNRKGMVWALAGGALIQAVIIILLVTAAKTSTTAALWLYGYISLITFMCVLTGVQQTIIASWIGDLVPVHQRGWFVSGMAITSNIGLVLFQLFFARISTLASGLVGYAALMGLVCLNTLVAIGLCYTVPDRPSLAVKFVSKKPDEHVNYKYGPMWLLIWFECAWRVGRVALSSFSTAYLLDYFGMKMSKIILLGMIINVVNIFMLYFVGRISDRTGTRRPLAVISAICATSMSLWVFSAWWGLWPVIAFQIINGMAGSTHWMLLTNLSLEVYPAKGRPNFLSFSRTLVGLVLMGGATIAGYLMSGIRGWSIMLWGAEFNHYHIFFLGCTLFTLGCLVPLWFLGKMKMPQHDEPVGEGVEG
ncbi:MAG: MFS transporter [Kiritimatiellae bacterium]|nr:MFS transporter [Kiritimatiellia bacterium]